MNASTIFPNGVVWITGLSGAGKSTLAAEVAKRLRDAGGAVVLLDGDELREIFGAAEIDKKNHGRDGRLALAFRYAALCSLLAQQGITVVIATISLFREIHEWNRKNFPRYFEIYLMTPMAELRRRDPKGIYRRFDAGELADVAGLDLPIDEPAAADWVVKFDASQSVETLADNLVERLKTRHTRE